LYSIELGTFDVYLKGTILIIKHAPQIYRATRGVVTDPIIRQTTGKLVNTLVSGTKTIYEDVNVYYYPIIRDKTEEAYNTASSALKKGTTTVVNTVTDLYNNPVIRDKANNAYRTVSAMSESVSNAYSGVRVKTETAIKSVTESVKHVTAGIDPNNSIKDATQYVSHYLLGSAPIRAKL
jgi:predicted nucleic acid-binding protein